MENFTKTFLFSKYTIVNKYNGKARVNKIIKGPGASLFQQLRNRAGEFLLSRTGQDHKYLQHNVTTVLVY